MGLDAKNFSHNTNLIFRGERKNARRVRKSANGGKNLCSLHECVANKSSFSMTNYYKKRWKMRKYCRQREIRWAHNGENGKDWKSKPSHFYWGEIFSHPETLNQLISRGRVEKHQFNFSFSISARTLAWRKYQESIFACRSASPRPPTQIAAHFSSSSESEYFYEEISFFIAIWKKMRFCFFSGWRKSARLRGLYVNDLLNNLWRS